MTLGIPSLLMVALAAHAHGQEFRLGLKGGVPATAYFDTGEVAVRGGTLSHSAATRRYTVGAAAEWRLRPRFGLELDALYKRIGYVQRENTTVSGVAIDSAFEVNGHSFDFPILAKFRGEGRVSPFAVGGVTLRYMDMGRARGTRTVQTAQSTTTTPIDTAESLPLFAPGATAAAGLDSGGGRPSFLAEVRYTRWRNTILSGPLRLTPNQVEFLVGILF
jgi:hypothetical protein